MAAKILCYPDSNDTWTFMNKGKRANADPTVSITNLWVVS